MRPTPQCPVESPRPPASDSSPPVVDPKIALAFRLKWLCFALAIHTIWGSYSTVTRFLLVDSVPPLDSQVVLVLTKVVGMAFLAIVSAVAHGREQAVAGRQLKEDEMALKENAEWVRKPAAKKEEKNLPWSSRKKIKYAMLWGFLATARAVLNIISCGMTLAYNIAVINALTPLFAPLMDKFFLGTKLPKSVPYAAVATTASCVLIAIAQSPLMGDIAHHDVTTSSNALGAALQFASMIFSNLARVMMSASKGVLTSGELIQVQNICTIVIGVSIVLITATKGWEDAMVALRSPAVLSAFLFLAIGIFTGGAYFQVEVIRVLGPGVYGTFSSFRVLVALLLSYFFLNEGLKNAAEGVGIAGVVVSLTVFMKTLAAGDSVKEDNPESKGGKVVRETQLVENSRCSKV